MKLGIFAKTYNRPTVEEVFAAVRADGLGCVQFNMACAGLPSLPDEIPAGLPERIRAAAQANGVEIAAVSGTYNLIHPDLELRAAGLRRLGVLARACKGLGTGVITICTGTRDPQDMWRHHPANDEPSAWTELIKEMESALRIAEENNLTLAIEPEHGNVVSSAQRGRLLLDQMGTPRLRVIIDGANLIEPGQDQRPVLDEAFDLLGGDMVMAHAKDRTADGGFCAAGLGILDFAHYLRRIHDLGFQGPVILHGLAENEVQRSLAALGSIQRGL
jgi:sugar phosphate isomerase/epimerase